MGNCTVVEGIVSDYQPAGSFGHNYDSFTVGKNVFGGTVFKISGNDTSAFHQTKSHGSPIENGTQVRIHSVGNAIVELEIAEKEK
jgi:hypothetical protein